MDTDPNFVAQVNLQFICWMSHLHIAIWGIHHILRTIIAVHYKKIELCILLKDLGIFVPYFSQTEFIFWEEDTYYRGKIYKIPEEMHYGQYAKD